MKILSDELEEEVLNTIGIDRAGIFSMYLANKSSRQEFERNFVMQEPTEAALSGKIWSEFLSFDAKNTINKVKQNENS